MKTLEKLLENGLDSLPLEGKVMGKIYLAHSVERMLLRNGRAKETDMVMIDPNEWSLIQGTIKGIDNEAVITARYNELKNWIDRAYASLELAVAQIEMDCKAISEDNTAYLGVLKTAAVIFFHMPSLVVTENLANKAKQEGDSIEAFSIRKNRTVAVVPDGSYKGNLNIVNDSYISLPPHVFDYIEQYWVSRFNNHPEKRKNVEHIARRIVDNYIYIRAIKETFNAFSRKLQIPELMQLDFKLEHVHALMEELEEDRRLFKSFVGDLINMDEQDRKEAVEIYDSVYPNWVKLIEGIPAITPGKKAVASRRIHADLQGFEVYQDFEMIIQAFQ